MIFLVRRLLQFSSGWDCPCAFNQVFNDNLDLYGSLVEANLTIAYNERDMRALERGFRE